jgi:hypothetical protein
MNKMILTTQVGPDGVLHVSVPLKPEDANKTARVMVEALEGVEGSVIRPTTPEEWREFIAKTAGSITDPTFERAPQGEYEQRDEF